MSNITGEGGSFSSGNTGEAEVQPQELLNQFFGANSSLLSSASANNDGLTASAHDERQQLQAPQAKKKRSLPGNPDPSAEVIALSPNALMATNRFVCEICNKGFQRDQNLQLHRRGHNLPWKLKQRGSAEIRKRVYVCPEPSCVHHNPARALGDLTGIKKHFCRKHGEKKWKCERCSKKYAVQSDWKAHSKTCGTREYKCDCGTIFSRRDSFITHRAFCDALTEENTKLSQALAPHLPSSVGQQPNNLSSSASVPLSQAPHSNINPSTEAPEFASHADTKPPLFSLPQGLILPPPKPLMMPQTMFSGNNLFGTANARTMAPPPSLIHGMNSPQSSSAIMSATALLQKAAQMGATVSNNSATGFVSAAMAPSSFGGMLQNRFMERGQEEITEQFMNNVNSDSDREGVFSGLLGQNSHDFLKSVEVDPGKTTTVDFLGIGGTRPAGNLHEGQREMHLKGFMTQFQPQTTLEKPMWEV
ncbi:zinc finger protein GAI-ASSOCIATED FACTOR 1-like isoform X2 [Rhodamnia argentea]|uniref:Zinc finger protein GAI-ASSOCIATED FACTOR 1-like isoform X2 n=1 Tax=Rhodamnia argentea TaxID=178133 RepID=A0A8B8QCT5_9MYRT|nr:zinc finger protein GAI-ASSOCIATED FACTOR 1-like isoform X2 [Rhodamnia argentea]